METLTHDVQKTLIFDTNKNCIKVGIKFVDRIEKRKKDNQKNIIKIAWFVKNCNDDNDDN